MYPEELDPAMPQLFVPRAAEIDQSQDKRLYSMAKVIAECASVQAAATYALQLDHWSAAAS